MNIERRLPIERYYFERKVDELGRVIIPNEIRSKLNIKVADKLKIYIEDNKIIFETK